MAENTAIEWADHTFNPWEGCQKVGPGCDHCYAETRNARFGGGSAPNWGPGAPRRRTSPTNWRKPLKWNAEARAFAEIHGRKQRVFCASLADVFDNAVDPAWRSGLFELIDRTPNLDWMLLTKRIGNVEAMLCAMGREQLGPHIWLGATIVNQEEADRDIPKLITAPAVIRFLSMEPLLGPVDLQLYRVDGAVVDAQCDHCDDRHEGRCVDGIDWVIVGGESGPGARPMHPDWARSLRDQCAAADVPFLFKQWGEWKPLDAAGEGFWPADAEGCCRLIEDGQRADGGWPLQRVGKKHAGRLLDGVQHDGFPT